MSNLQDKIHYLIQLGNYMLSDAPAWVEAKERAVQGNQWFTQDQIDLAATNIADCMLQQDLLEDWVSRYTLPQAPVTIGITMAGNIPLVGFHDFLCGYLSGHHLRIKYSSKDQVLLPHLLQQLAVWDPAVTEQVQHADMLKGCDAYIATGSNNSARYFEQYFSKYPHIIRRNRTSVAVLDGSESDEELRLLAGDVFSFFGLGCRNVTQVALPRGYDISRLFRAFEPYSNMIHHHKYRNNYDYYLAIYLLNRVPYLSNESVLLVENEVPFSAVAVLHYRYYDDKEALVAALRDSEDIQCIVGKDLVPFGASQRPSLTDYADGVDVMQFCCSL